MPGTKKSGGHMGMMSLETFKRIIDQAAGRCDAVTLASRGEPLICPKIDEMLKYASRKFLALKLNTNAWFLDEAKSHAILQADMNTVVFSADAASEPTYSQFRVGGTLDRVVKTCLAKDPDDRWQSAREVRHGQFVFVGVNERAAGVSGCSVDALVRRMGQLQSLLGVDLTDNAPVLFRRGERIERVPRERFAELAAAGEVSLDTVVFDNTVQNVGGTNTAIAILNFGASGTIAGNVVGFNTQAGISISPTGSLNSLKGNFVGTDPTGRNLGNLIGLRIDGSNNTIGSTNKSVAGSPALSPRRSAMAATRPSHASPACTSIPFAAVVKNWMPA